MLQRERDRQKNKKNKKKIRPPAWHILDGKDDKINFFLCGLMIYIWSSFTSSIENVMQLILSKIGHLVYNFSNLFHVS